MRRFLGGLVLVAHGLAHALPAAQAGAAGTSWALSPIGLWPWIVRWIVALLSTLAMTGFVTAGFGVWGAPIFRRPWRGLGVFAAGASALFLLLFWLNAWGVVGLAIDAAIVIALRRVMVVRLAPEAPKPRPAAWKRLSVAVAKAGAVAFVVWLALVSVTAPWHRFWGSTPSELAMELPGDQSFEGSPTYWIEHAVSIDAPPEVVWPWLAQLGTDRGGFYSHDWLERAAGIDVHNASRIHHEWQDRRTGDLVVAAPAGYLGLEKPLGWELTLVRPRQVMVLENWGAFVLLPDGEGGTRFIVRTRNGQPPGMAGLAMAWFGLVAFEPAHFIMERAMLLGVKQRAEGTIRAVG